MATEKPVGATNIGTDDDPTRGRPYHDSETAKLKQLIKSKVIIDDRVKHFESQVATREQEYFESTPYGNILIGFDNYIKGSSAAAGAGRRKAAFSDSDRVFSRSTILRTDTIDSPAASSVATTPAPTPANGTAKGDTSGAATPTSATSKSAATQKKGKRPSGDDSETETKDSKRLKTSRK